MSIIPGNETQYHRFPKGNSKEDLIERQLFLKKLTNIDFETSENPDPARLKGIIENQIGHMSVPMGMAGPMYLEGDYTKGLFYVPLCTVEGTLVASMNRGMHATYKCGGIQTTHIQQRMTRSPFFILEHVRQQKQLINWVKDHYTEIKTCAESTTQYGKLIEIEKHVLNKNLVLDFAFDTANAAGQNMVSKATFAACEMIREQTGIDFVLDSNFSSDKKASAITNLKGRGHYVVAQASLSHYVIEKILGTNVEEINKLMEFGAYASSAAGNNGIQLHLSNALAAIYMATGQDVACLAENAIGYTQTKITEEGMDFLLTMPSISVGTVGGGTRLPQQQKNLQLLGCTDQENSAKQLAEIICASALCLEISLIAAIVSEKWVNAHMKHGRNHS